MCVAGLLGSKGEIINHQWGRMTVDGNSASLSVLFVLPSSLSPFKMNFKRLFTESPLCMLWHLVWSQEVSSFLSAFRKHWSRRQNLSQSKNEGCSGSEVAVGEVLERGWHCQQNIQGELERISASVNPLSIFSCQSITPPHQISVKIPRISPKIFCTSRVCCSWKLLLWSSQCAQSKNEWLNMTDEQKTSHDKWWPSDALLFFSHQVTESIMVQTSPGNDAG